MAYVDDKLKEFDAIVKKQAQQQAEAVREAAKAKSDADIKAYEKMLEIKMQDQIDSEKELLQIEEQKAFSRFQTGERAKYFIRRAELEKDLFAAVKTCLEAYQDSPAYEKMLLDTVKKLGKEGFSGRVIFYVREKDLPLAKKIGKAFGAPCEVLMSTQIKIGGIRYENVDKRYVIDDTFDQALRDQKEVFHQMVNPADIG